jgi:hypothetical protein
MPTLIGCCAAARPDASIAITANAAAISLMGFIEIPPPGQDADAD